MIVRIRLTRGSGSGTSGIKAALAGLLTLLGVMCFVMGSWILLAGLGWAGEFVLRQGVFSHWQVWMACGVVAQLISFRLNRTLPAGPQDSSVVMEKAL